MQNILIVSDTQSYLWMSLKEKLEEMKYQVSCSSLEPDEINKAEQEADAVFLFMEEEMLKNHKGMVFLKDKAIEEDIPIFVCGAKEELKELEKDIPKYLVKVEFVRPVNVNEAVAAIDKYFHEYGKQNKKKILVVDDNGTMLRNIKGWLSDKYNVILANSGARAIKYLALNEPDLVLLDYEMPVVDGRQVLEIMRTESEYSDIPVIFLTGKGDKESVMQVMALKPDGYLLKSMPPQDIIRTIDEFFEKRKALGL